MLQSKSDDGPRWPRGQKFTLSLAGREAHGAHREAVLSARGLSRAALDAALSAWAAPRQVQPGDGVLLGEMLDRPRPLPELMQSLESAGSSPAEVRAAMGRLVSAGLVDLVPTARQAEQPSLSMRWAR